MFCRILVIGLLGALAALATGCTTDTANSSRDRNLAPAYESPPRPSGGCCH